MSDTLQERLRGTYSTGPFGKRDFAPYIPAIQTEAADYIDQLEADKAKLVEALEDIANGSGYYGLQASEYKDIARAALAEMGKGEGDE